MFVRLGDCFFAQQRWDAAIALYHLGRSQTTDSASIDARLTTARMKLSPPSRTEPSSSSPVLQYFETTLDWVQTTNLPNVDYCPVSWEKMTAQTSECMTSSCSTPPFSAPPSSKSLSSEPLSSEPPSSELPSSQSAVCGGVTCSTCMTNLCDRFKPHQLYPNILQCNSPEALNTREAIAIAPLPTFVVTIPDGRVWNEPQQNTWAICNSIGVMTPDHALLGDLSRYYPWFLPNCRHSHHHNHPVMDGHDSLNQDSLHSNAQLLDGRVVVLSGLSGHIYYHWIFDVLPRLGILQQAGWSWEQVDAFVVNSLSRPFQRETLALLGVPESKVLESDRYPHLQATELIVPSFPGHFDWVPSGTIEFLRSAFLPPAAQLQPPHPQRSWPRYLYISRSQATYRRIFNEDELIAQLQPLGFTVLHLETLSVLEQVAFFSYAEIIVTPHGAGLTNSVFCQSGSHIIEIVSPNYVRTDYWIVSYQVGLSHYVVTGDTVECAMLRQIMYQSPLTEDIWLSAATLAAMIDLLNRLIPSARLSQSSPQPSARAER
ncbi:MAG: glycosyltransferase family 61 protein [Merismopedia sp. SIO2A8]|nr:glycosyltransferase family 61 protein [Merismopedia sp. SIO2A8]